jgi:hypothetical protein
MARLIQTIAAGALCLMSVNVLSQDVFKDAARAGVAAAAHVVFSDVERRLIGDYYRGHPELLKVDVSIGESKRGKGDKPLPPGIALKLARSGTLPPGIAKRYLPSDLEHRLPPVRAGYERVQVGLEVLLIEIATGIIVDVLTLG